MPMGHGDDDDDDDGGHDGDLEEDGDGVGDGDDNDDSDVVDNAGSSFRGGDMVTSMEMTSVEGGGGRLRCDL